MTDNTSPSQTSPRTDPLRPIMRTVLILLIAFFAFKNVVYQPLRTPSSDFRTYYRYAHVALEGENPYVDLNPDDANAGYVYPLFALVFIFPFSFMGLEKAILAWWALGAACMFAGAVGAFLYVRRQPLSDSGLLGRLGGGGLLAALMVLAFVPGRETLRWGQIDVVTTALIACVVLLGAQKRRIGAGLLYAIAVLLKGAPILLLPALLPRLGLAGFLVTVVVGAGYWAMLIANNLWQWEWYLWTEKMPYWAQRTDATTISFYHTFANLLHVAPAAASMLANALEIGIGLIMIVGLVVFWRKRVAWPWHAAWGAACALPMSRFLEFHQMILLNIPLVILLASTARTGFVAPGLFALASMLLINLGHPPVQAQFGLDAAAEVFYYSGLFLCAFGVMHSAPRETRRTNETQRPE